MATFRRSIFDWRTRLDGSGNVYPAPYTAFATNDVWKHRVWAFNNPSADISMYGAVDVPNNYVGSAALIVVWTSTVTSGDFAVQFDYRAIGGNDTESFDQATAQETVNGTDTAPSATDERMEFSIALTAGNFAAGDTVEWIYSRDDSADTLAGIVLVKNVFFQYSDT